MCVCVEGVFVWVCVECVGRRSVGCVGRRSVG